MISSVGPTRSAHSITERKRKNRLRHRGSHRLCRTQHRRIFFKSNIAGRRTPRSNNRTSVGILYYQHTRTNYRNPRRIDTDHKRRGVVRSIYHYRWFVRLCRQRRRRVPVVAHKPDIRRGRKQRGKTTDVFLLLLLLLCKAELQWRTKYWRRKF